MARLIALSYRSEKRVVTFPLPDGSRATTVDMLLLLKLVLVPALVAAVTLASRRWGLRVAGVVTGFPLVAGPTYVFLAIEPGNAFAADAARAAILGLVATTAFAVAYASTAARANWLWSVLAGWVAFVAAGAVVTRLPPIGQTGEVMVAIVVIAIGSRFLVRPFAAATPAGPPRSDLLLRMGAAAGAVILFTALAELVGPQISGVLSVFPVVTAILAAFTHVQRGHHAAAVFLRGLLSGLYGLVLFCLVLSLALTRWTLPLLPALTLAIGSQMAIQSLLLWRIARRSAAPSKS